MHLVLIVLLLAVPVFAKSRSNSSSHVTVKGHTTKSGKYVEPHHRSRPNMTETDNWTTKGNTNPDTGKRGTRTPKK